MPVPANPFWRVLLYPGGGHPPTLIPTAYARPGVNGDADIRSVLCLEFLFTYCFLVSSVGFIQCGNWTLTQMYDLETLVP